MFRIPLLIVYGLLLNGLRFRGICSTLAVVGNFFGVAKNLQNKKKMFAVILEKVFHHLR